MKSDVCIHYNGVYNPMIKPNVCEKGIAYRELVGGENSGWIIRLPCFKSHDTNIKCELYLEPTTEELNQWEKKQDEHVNRMLASLPLLEKLKSQNKKGGSGTCECPLCKGELNWSISPTNNHGRLVCETENCVNIIE